MTLNVHQIVHLADNVRYTGPLYVNNCFIFEDLNGFIIKHIHGTQGVDTQITNIISMLKVPPLMFNKFLKNYDDLVTTGKMIVRSRRDIKHQEYFPSVRYRDTLNDNNTFS